MRGTPTCPEVQSLERFQLGQSTEEEGRALEEHLEQCDSCLAILQTIQGEDSLVEAMRAPGAAGQASAGETVRRLVERLKRLPPAATGPADDRTTTLHSQASHDSTIPPPAQPQGTADATPPLPSAPDSSQRLTQTRDSVPPSAGPIPLAEPVYDFLAPAQAPGEMGMLGPYHVLRVLGAGGMGVVFLAHDPHLERPVALKAMLPGVASGPSAKQRFLREARAAAAIKHDHIVTIYQVGEDRGVPFLAMEFLEGESLDDRLRCEGKLPFNAALRIGWEMADGLAAAHKRGLIHRDVKPANVWLEGDRARVKILDFGLVRAATDGSGEVGPASDARSRSAADEVRLTQAGAIVGTPAFMAPEQAEGKPVDARCDLFSLGCVLYQMAAGKPPFQRKDLTATLRAVSTESPPRPQELNVKLSKEFSDLIMWLLAKDPADRPPSASQVAWLLRRIDALEREQGSEAGVWQTLTGDDSGVRALAADEVIRRPEAAGAARRSGAVARSAPPRRVPNSVRVGVPVAAVVLLSLATLAGYWFRPAAPVSGPNNPDTTPALLERAGEIRRFEGHTGAVESLSFSPDGRRVLSGSGWPASDGTMRLWDVETGKEIHKFEGDNKNFAQDVAFLPKTNGRYALSGGPGAIRIWDVETGKEVRHFTGDVAAVDRMVVSPTGRYALSWSEEGPVQLWDVATGREVRRFEKLPHGALSAAFSADDGRVLTGGRDNTARLWDVGTGRLIRTLVGHSNWVHGVAFAPAGDRAVTASFDGTLRLWDVETGAELRRYRGHLGAVRGVAFLPDGKRFLSAGEDDTVRLWDVDTVTELWRFGGHKEIVTAVAVSPDGKLAVSGGGGVYLFNQWQSGTDFDIRLWRLPDREGPQAAGEVRPASGGRGRLIIQTETPEVPLLLKQRGRPVRSIDLLTGGQVDLEAGEYEVEPVEADDLRASPERFTLAQGGRQVVAVRPVAGFGEVRRFLGHTGAVRSVAFSPDGKRAISGGWDNTLRLWDVDTGQEIRRFDGRAGFYSAAFSPDGRTILSGDYGGVVQLWDVESGKAIRSYKGNTQPISSVAFSPDGKRVLSGGWDRTLRLWDVETEKELQVLNGHSLQVWTVAFLPDGRRALSGGWDGAICLWDLKEGREIGRLNGNMGMVACVAVSSDGLHALSRDGENMVRLWDLTTEQQLRGFYDKGTGLAPLSPGGVRGGESVAFSPDGRRALSGNLRLWDVATGREICRFHGQAESILSVAFSPDGRYALSSGYDSAVHLWRLPDPAPSK